MIAVTRHRMVTLLVIATGMLFAPGVVAPAAAVGFNLAPGAYTADTTALTITGQGRNDVGVDQGGVAVFIFDSVSIPDGATITVRGNRPFRLVSSGSLTLAGVIDGSGASATNYTPVANAGGPGGAGGGASFPEPGKGPGGGSAASAAQNGGGGGGFGGRGAAGGIQAGDPGTGGAGGGSYGDLNAQLQAGSGGGGASATATAVGGGGGGGAIALVGDTVVVPPTGLVRVNGGDGAVGDTGASGGGSGGAIVVRGVTVNVAGTLQAQGGKGGAGSCCGDGGGGGGGRVAYQYRTLAGSGIELVGGGDSGAADGLNPGLVLCSPNCGHGGLSPDTTGADGTVTMTPTAVAITTPDADRDGVRVPQDCNDSNPAIRPGAKDVPGNGVDEDCSGSGELARVATRFSALWRPFEKQTTVRRLALRNVPKGATVIVTCTGKGCPLKSKKLTFKNARTSYSLTSLFNRTKKGAKKPTVAKLRVRTKVEIDVLLPNAIGTYVTYTIRAGRSPKRGTGCLVPGGTVKRKC